MHGPVSSGPPGPVSSARPAVEAAVTRPQPALPCLEGSRSSSWNVPDHLGQNGARSNLSPTSVKGFCEAESLPEKLRVLVADDCRVQRRSLKMAIKQARPKWKVVEADTAEAAVSLVVGTDLEPFGLICMDEMFGLDSEGVELMRGSEAVRRMREHERSTCSTTPAVIVSVTSSLQNEDLLTSGAHAVWSKPISCIDLSLQHELAHYLWSVGRA